MKYGHPDGDEAKQQLREQLRERRLYEKGVERRQWADYTRTYERCKAIAEAVWKDELEKAAAQQQALAEQMRDRGHDQFHSAAKAIGLPANTTLSDAAAITDSVSIPVPLFTPRDRLQFLKEATANLMIGTERRGLTVTPEVKDATELAATEKAPEGQGPVEAASGADETQSDTPGAVEDATAYGERIPETAQPGV